MRLHTYGLSALFFLLPRLPRATGTITGTIEDPAGAVVPGAPVEVKNMDTGTIYKGGASGTGNYVIPVPVGKYELSVTVTGFKKYVRQNLEVLTATDTRQDVNLTVGNITDTVTVNESAPLLKTESAEISHTVTNHDADDLPVLTIGGLGGFAGLRDPMQMSILLPGVSYTTDTVLRVNGIPSGTEAIRIEGQDATNNMFNGQTSVTQPGVDAIQEVSIQTSNFAAEYGQAAGGYFNFTMKSGTNQYHGSVYDYLRNEAINTGLPYTDRCVTNSLQCGQHVRPQIRENDWGFTVGGPIERSQGLRRVRQILLFFNLEQFLLRATTTGLLDTVPTAAYQAGNFGAPFVNSAGVTTSIGPTPTCTVISAACPAIGGLDVCDSGWRDCQGWPGPPDTRIGVYDPLTAQQTATGVVNNLFPNGQIPANRLDPVALNFRPFCLSQTSTTSTITTWFRTTPTHRTLSIGPSSSINR